MRQCVLHHLTGKTTTTKKFYRKIYDFIYSSLTIYLKSDFFQYFCFVFSFPTLEVMFLENVAESCDCMVKAYSGGKMLLKKTLFIFH